METKNPEYAGFWLRFIAYVIDAVIISFVEFLLILPMLGLFGINIALLESGTLDGLEEEFLIPALISAGSGLYLSAFLISWLYYALLESGPRQGTIGKMALGIVVTDMDGTRINFAKASLRFFSKIISSAILMIGYIMAGITQRKQALHDIIANTLVTRK